MKLQKQLPRNYTSMASKDSEAQHQKVSILWLRMDATAIGIASMEDDDSEKMEAWFK